MFFVQIDVFELKDSLLFLDGTFLWQQMPFILLNDTNSRWPLLLFKKVSTFSKINLKMCWQAALLCEMLKTRELSAGSHPSEG